MLDYTKNEFHRFDRDNRRLDQLETLYVSHAYYQFGKIIGDTSNKRERLLELYWKKARAGFKDMSGDSIAKNKYLQEKEKEFYFDVSKHPVLDEEIKNKYF